MLDKWSLYCSPDIIINLLLCQFKCKEADRGRNRDRERKSEETRSVALVGDGAVVAKSATRKGLISGHMGPIFYTNGSILSHCVFKLMLNLYIIASWFSIVYGKQASEWWWWYRWAVPPARPEKGSHVLIHFKICCNTIIKSNWYTNRMLLAQSEHLSQQSAVR